MTEGHVPKIRQDETSLCSCNNSNSFPLTITPSYCPFPYFCGGEEDKDKDNRG